MDENKAFYIYVVGGFGFWGECSGFSGPYTEAEATKHAEDVARMGYGVTLFKAVAEFSREPQTKVVRKDL